MGISELPQGSIHKGLRVKALGANVDKRGYNIERSPYKGVSHKGVDANVEGVGTTIRSPYKGVESTKQSPYKGF